MVDRESSQSKLHILTKVSVLKWTKDSEFKEPPLSKTLNFTSDQRRVSEVPVLSLYFKAITNLKLTVHLFIHLGWQHEVAQFQK